MSNKVSKTKKVYDSIDISSEKKKGIVLPIQGGDIVSSDVKKEYEAVKKLRDEKKNMEVVWKDDVDKDDYEAARDYLELVIGDRKLLKKLIKRMKSAKIVTKKAKDILRASGLTKLGGDNIYVAHNINKYRMGIKLSPILLVVSGVDRKLIIADGYHRTCASCILSEDLNVRCKIVTIE